MIKKYIVVAFAFLAFIAGCVAPTTKRVEVDDVLVELEAMQQREIALKDRMKDQKRLMGISYPILYASAELCGKKIRPSLGLIYANKHAFQESLQDTAIRIYGMGEALKIIQVVPGSPGAEAGFREGDILVSFNEESVPMGFGAAKKFFLMQHDEMKSAEPVKISIMRDGALIDINVTPREICDYPVIVGGQTSVNAYADGQKVVIFKGMLRFAEDDQELALVVSHELAHNIMKHIEAKTQNYMLGMLVDLLAAAYGINTQGMFGQMAARAYSQDFEAEADYVGLYMMARTGLKIDNAALFWRRMAALHPGSIEGSHLSTHPATPARFMTIEETVKEIQAKIDAGRPLEPEYNEQKKEIDGEALKRISPPGIK
ncbi:M48 family metalloprotease [Thermodesulfobacteriota bacterium]